MRAARGLATSSRAARASPGCVMEAPVTACP
jgi:hypothetical protein